MWRGKDRGVSLAISGRAMAGFQGRAMAGSQGRAMAGSQGMAEAGEAPLPSLHMDTEEDDNEYNEYEEADPGYLTNVGQGQATSPM
ncbi:hypothetical protein ACOMHN_030457 [Nucella lapillus]